ncbi:MAG: MaoC/PaaZ C-terminal domain-containing protein [Microcella sp.]
MSIADTLNLELGQVVADETLTLTRDALVRYAGASGDFNPIHYRDDVAASVGLPGVLAHGMLTMGVAIGAVTDWLDARGWVTDYQVRFTRPVVVDPSEGAEVQVVATVGAIDDDEARIDLTVSYGGQTVLGKAQARIRSL